ncbi:hypothetical protein DAPPUDRAFT_249304 [Daphnia pulex]|uniref:Uncharacterized protein n=1 Tax=Daphnia pulex TaxID=6669 RepID=E9GWD6_DAPPU|nr:hypothetical protein DAPPUDRAFT_249304 [Daphnia pulex]|eukprot:EFX76207.1 hypothetical protein DAPPUDRAFT_249304 [Daphnia pulex]
MEISDDSDAISDSEEEYSRSIGTIVTVNRMQDVSIGYNAALEKRMYRAQQERKPPNPTSFDEAEELIREHPHYS